MEVTVLLSKATPKASWKAQLRGNGPELGKNLLTGERRTAKIDEARSHAKEAVEEILKMAPGKVTLKFEIQEQQTA